MALVAPVSNASPSNEPPFVDRRYNVTISLHVHVVNVKFLTLKGVTGKVRRCNADLSIGTFFNIGLKCTVRRTAGLIMIIIIIFLHGLGPLTCSGIDALPSFPRTSTISSSSLLMSTLFSLGGLPAHPQNSHSWRTSLSLLVWLLSYGLSGLEGPTRNIKFPPS